MTASVFSLPRAFQCLPTDFFNPLAFLFLSNSQSKINLLIKIYYKGYFNSCVSPGKVVPRLPLLGTNI